MVHFKPHTARLVPGSAATGTGNAVQVAAFDEEGEGVRSISGRFAPLAAETAYTRLGIVVREPHRFFCEVDESRQISVGDRLEWSAEGRAFKVHLIQRYVSDPSTSRAELTLESLEEQGEG